jgi:hypothetical protein
VFEAENAHGALQVLELSQAGVGVALLDGVMPVTDGVPAFEGEPGVRAAFPTESRRNLPGETDTSL